MKTLDVIQLARKLDFDDVRVHEIEAIALGQEQRFEEARRSLRRSTEQHSILGRPAEKLIEPPHVILFSGHMIDDPSKRGSGRPKPARFPWGHRAR